MRTDPFRALGRTSAALLAALVLAPVAEAAPKQKRYGIEGEIVRYDEAAKALVVRVLQTKVAGRFASGNTVGGEAPADVRRGAEMSFAVEPEGSVLRRTVIKAMTGGGLDTSGTKQGFKAALAKIPTDRPVVMSIEKNGKADPAYKILLVQIQMTEQELQERFDRISVEEE